jgi:cytochrome c oxidase cbb3-type subunit III
MQRSLRLERSSACAWLVAFWVLVLASSLARRSAAAEPAAGTNGPALYARYCQLCHGADATGYAADDAPSLVSPTFLASASDAFIAAGIRFGRPETAMAAYGKVRGGPLTEGQISAIVKFLRSKGPAASRLPARKVSGDATRGAALFLRECKTCHGTPQARGKAPQLHNPEFLAAASPAFLRHAIQKGRRPTRMPAFERNLRASQIEDLVAWLVSLRPANVSAPRAPPLLPTQGPVVIHPKGKAPEFSLREGRFVSAEQVKRALDAQRRLIIIDARAASDWAAFRIPGAVSIPYYETAQLDRIPNDGTWVVAYCACPHHASGEVVDALRKRNYPHTAVLDEGILFWRSAGYAVEGQAAGPAGAR